VRDPSSTTRDRRTTRRVLVRTGVKLAYTTPVVVATFELTPLRAAAKGKDVVSLDEAAAAAAQTANTPPVADAGRTIKVTDTDGNGVETVTLDGSGSSDPDGTIVAYQWTIDGDWVASDPVATVMLPVGRYLGVLTVTDDAGETATDNVRIIVEPPAVPEPPAAPSGLAAKQRRDLVSLSWKDRSDDESGFRVYRSLDGGATWAAIGETPTDKRSLRDADVVPGGTYVYAVAAFNDAGESAWSDVVWITVEGTSEPAPAQQEQDAGQQTGSDQGAAEQAPAPPQPPAAPTDLTAKEKESRVELTWIDRSDDERGFRVYRSVDGGTKWTPIGEVAADQRALGSGEMTPADRPFRDPDVAPGGTYAYAVTAFNDAGESDRSDPAWITLEPPPEPPPVEKAPADEPQSGDAGANQAASAEDTAPTEDVPADGQSEGGQGGDQTT
jgi:hypothetical protein